MKADEKALANFQTEAQFADAIIELAQLLGWKVKRDPMYRATAASPGFPDLVLARNGVIHLWELKVGQNRLSVAQQAWGEAMGAQWRCLRPDDWPEIEKLLK